MKIFLKKSAVFVVLGLAILLIIGNFYIYATKLTLDNKVFDLGDNVETLILGDSRIQSGINPDYIPRSRNISKDTEHYFYNYYKLKHYLKRNPQIKNVILGYSYSNITKHYDTMWFIDKDFSARYYDYYYVLLDKEGKDILKRNKSLFLFAWLKYDIGIPIQPYTSISTIKQIFNRHINVTDYSFSGKFHDSNRSNVNLEKINKKIRKFYEPNSDLLSVSPIMVQYLYKIINLCHENKIKIYLFNAPLFSQYKNGMPLKVMDNHRNLLESIQHKYPDVQYLDYSEYPLKQEYFGDEDHMNSLGATIISKDLARIIYSRDAENPAIVDSRGPFVTKQNTGFGGDGL
jgi:hypothetical protein